MDEVHNLTADAPRFARWKAKLKALKKMLETATNATIVGLTATPIRSDPEEAKPLLEVQGTHQRRHHRRRACPNRDVSETHFAPFF